MVQTFRPIPADRLKLVVFDLDGTLVDSAQDLSNSVNATLDFLALKRLPDAQIAGYVGNGVPLLLRRSLGAVAGIEPEAVAAALLERAQTFFLEHYGRHLLDFTKLYDGAREALTALDEPGRRTLAMLTNKPVKPSIGICEGLGVARHFAHIYGGDSFKTKKPDPEGLLALMRQLGVTAEETVMVGDSKGDVGVARNAGTWSLGCAFGFGPQNLLENKPDVVVDSAHDWLSILKPVGESAS